MAEVPNVLWDPRAFVLEFNLGLFLGNSSHYFGFLVFDNWVLISHLSCLHTVGAEGSKCYYLEK